MGYDFELEGQLAVVHPAHGLGEFALLIEGRRVVTKLTAGQSRGEFLIRTNGQTERVFIASSGDFQFIHFRGRTHQVEAINALHRAQQDAAPSGGDDALVAPMPGVVVEVATEVGAVVESGQLLMTIESMKLQTAIVAPNAGRVAEICLSAGASFNQGATLIRLEAPQSEEGDSQ